MNIKKLNWFLNSGTAPTVAWYLGNGTVPASTGNTIYDPISAANLAASYVNLANPGTRDAIVGVAPTHTQGLGWTFNGSTQYLNTSIKADSTSTVIILVQDHAVNTGYAFGAWDSNARRLGVRPNSTSLPRWEFASTVLTNGYNFSGAIMAISQNGVYLNGYKLNTNPAWATTIMTASLYIGCYNQNTPVTFYNGKVGVFAHYNTTLSDAQVLAVSNAIMDQYIVGTEDSYQSTVLASDPTYYLPLNTKAGFTIYKEYVMNGFASAVAGNTLTSGNTGQHGNCVTLPGLATNLLRPNLDLSSVLSNDEFSVAMWVKYTTYPVGAEAVRHSNQYTNGTSEYAVLELRNGPSYGIYQKEQAVTDNIIAGLVPVSSLGSWCHLVQYNSKSSGRRGLYINGVKLDFSRNALPGFTSPPGAVTNYYPELFSTLNGSAQHVSFYDHELTQAEVDALYVL